MEAHPDIPHSGHVLGPVPIDALTFPNRCTRCGKEATVDIKLRMTWAKDDLLGVMSAFLPLPPPREEHVDVYVPSCRWCREWRGLLKFLGLLGAMLLTGLVGVGGVLLGVYLGYEVGVSGWIIAVYVFLVLSLMFVIMWFAMSRLPRIIDRRVLRVTFDKYYPSSRTAVLTFTDLATAEEVAEATLQTYLARRRWEAPPVG